MDYHGNQRWNNEHMIYIIYSKDPNFHIYLYCFFRVLSVLISSLDSLLLLQAQYKIQDKLLACQAANVPHEGFVWK